MAAPKAKSLQEQFGFLDEDLKTPAHDALIFWIDDYIPEILAEIFNLTQAPMIVDKRWELPLKNDRGLLLGAADMFVKAYSGDQVLAVFIEAKPKICSLGELIRYIHFYEAVSNYFVRTHMGDHPPPSGWWSRRMTGLSTS